MKKYKSHLFVVLSLFLFLSCTQKPKEFKLDDNFVNLNKEILVESDENNEKVEELAKSISESIYEGDSKIFLSKFDTDYFFNKITNRFNKGSRFINEVRNGMFKHIESFPEKIIEEVNYGAIYDYVNYEYNEQDKAYYILFRFFSENSGINYHKYRVSKRDNVFFFNDMYIYLTGEYLSQTMARMLFSMEGNSSFQGFFDRSYKNDIERMLKVRKLMNKQEFREAYKVLSSFEGKLKNEKFIYIMRTQTSAQFNESLYKEELQRFFEDFPNDKTIYLHKMDYYLLEGDYDQALKILDELKEDTKDDFIEYLKGNVNFAGNRLEEAMENFKNVTENYEEFILGHFSYITCLIKAERYEEVISELDMLMILGYSVSDIINYIEEDVNGVNEFENFTLSKIYINWKGNVLSKVSLIE